MYTLIVVILASTLQNPKPHEALKVSLLFDTAFTCEQAGDALDTDFITKAYKAKHKGSRVTEVTTVCQRNTSNRI